ncbi:peptidase M4 [Paenibacillus albidus]|uniref:Peptidase M4 n=1 Tax=Paenibacillus albidus TaxID=2041023 RepID=A0A917FAE2_9BACL|nr:S-layer homology domain-containing protein [Paenibacillus albidus]GGF59633.1 peptidase M4 [Paenibacillus albidus]
MNSNNGTHFIHQTTKAALVTAVALALLLPSSLAGAASSSAAAATTVTSEDVKITAETGVEVAADPSKVKFSKEQAIAKLRELFPALNDATVSRVELGSNNSYPPSPNQMVWNVQWQYDLGNSGYGFNSEVDAVTGDLINTYISFPRKGNETYYPPKITREEALEKAKAFISKAAGSIKSTDLKLEEGDLYSYNNTPLFGPVQYGFSFSVLKNGIPSQVNNLVVSVDGDGTVTQFSKPSGGLEYPSAQPKITQAQAEKSVKDHFDVRLYYVPVYENGAVTRWVLGWRPTEQALYSLDAHTGKRLDQEGAEAPSAPVTYVDVPQGKEIFQSRSESTEITAEQAAKQAEKVGYIPAGRKLASQTLSNVYTESSRKVWMLSWEEGTRSMGTPPQQSYAQVDAATGQILNFQSEQYNFDGKSKVNPAPAGAKKLTAAEAKAKAVALVNSLYPKASSVLKQIDYGDNWSLLPDGSGYRYQFILLHNEIPVSNSNVSVNLDVYGRLQSYNANINQNIGSIKQAPEAKVTKQEALEAYAKQFQVKLQYKQIGGYMVNSSYTEPKVKLVYDFAPVEAKNNFEVLDAVTGKWSYIYGSAGNSAGAVEASDIKGHAAEQALAELVKYGVLVPGEDGKVNPDQEITTGEWITLIAKAANPNYAGYNSVNNERKAVAGVSSDSPDYEAVSFAASSGWISSDTVLQTESKLSREQLAVLLTSFVKYNKFAAYLDKDPGVSQFSDAASISNKGAVAVAVKLGLLQDDNGKFNPQQNVTRGTAASVIMKLVELQGKTDQVMGSNPQY